jgi:hypothetical protein
MRSFTEWDKGERGVLAIDILRTSLDFSDESFVKIKSRGDAKNTKKWELSRDDLFGAIFATFVRYNAEGSMVLRSSIVSIIILKRTTSNIIDILSVTGNTFYVR